MRVALASIHPRSLSGQIEGLVGLAHALRDRGNSVQVVSAFPDRVLLSDERIQLARQSRRLLFDQPARMTRIFVQLVRIAPRVDVIQLNLPTPAFSIYADLLQAFVRVPVIVGYEAHLVRARDLLRRDRLGAAPDFYFLRLLINNHLCARVTLRRAAAWIVNTEYQKAELIALGGAPARIHLLPPILPRDKLARVPRETARANFPPGRLVTFVGHYNHVKGVEVLVRAFRLLAPRAPDTRLVLAWSGIGSDRRVNKWLADRALAGRVIQLGQVHVPELLSASEVVVLPYRLTMGQAALPATLLEVYAANVPLVISDLPALRELTHDGKTALLVPPDDPDALAAAIVRVLTEPALAASMMQAQREWVERIQPVRAVKEYERLYQAIVAQA
jgi:glycosyltransferase involved in cell wall biosynthesis